MFWKLPKKTRLICFSFGVSSIQLLYRFGQFSKHENEIFLKVNFNQYDDLWELNFVEL